MERFFIPFTQVKSQPALVVDSLHPNGLVLSHWRGAPTPASVRGDTSADIVLNALHQQLPALNCPAVTANHFDIDGFVGVWALLYPELARQHEPLLRLMAQIGDFRELNLDLPEADRALKLVCWINAREKALFYPPFGAGELEENEVVASVPKFDYFLAAFGSVLADPEPERHVWEPEYQQVIKDYQVMHGNQTRVQAYPEIGLAVIDTPEPLHYYALFSRTSGYDMVLARYAGNRYELEYKYTTWVDLDSRPTLPRVSLQPLVRALNNRENGGRRWTGESVTDTGPILRLAGKSLSRPERYANPTERPIHTSSVRPEVLLDLVLAYYQQVYAGIQPKKYWSWDEIKELSRLSGQVI